MDFVEEENNLTNINNKAVKRKKKGETTDLRKFTRDEVKLLKPKNYLDHPFKNFEIANSDFLNTITGRTLCKICKKSRKYFCYTCYIPVFEIEDKIPKVKLPCHIDIIKHPKEIDGKSTAIHAAVLAHEDVSIYTYPDIPDYTLSELPVLLIFPDKDSILLENLWPKKDCQDNSSSFGNPTVPFSKAVFIDCTWNQVKKIKNDERMRGLTSIELKSQETLFWRYQTGKPNTYLATIEAIYYFLVAVHTECLGLPYNHNYDNILFFFKFMYYKIHSLYGSESLFACKQTEGADIR